MRIIATLLAAVCVVLPQQSVSTQPPSSQQLPRPTFETGVDLISVDVHVVDKRGNPIGDLTADDFEVDIAGRRRKISSLQFVAYGSPVSKPPGVPVTSVSPSKVPRARRMFVIAVDEHSLHTSNAMAAVTAAERFIDRLHPDDLVGVYAYPTGAAQHDMTTDHAAVRKALQKIGGLFSEPANNLNLSPSEIIDCANNDRDCLAKVWQRECGGNACTQRQVQQEAIGLAGLMETMATQSIGGLRTLLRGLKDIPGRKTLVLVSGGMVTTDQSGGRMNVRSEIAVVGRDASLANVNVFALHLDWSFIQAVTNRRGMRTSYFREANMAASGLEAVADNAGGTVIRVQGTSPDVAFDRVLSETAGHYLLGVESVDTDRNGQAQAIRVKVKRGGVLVRSRTFVTIAASQKSLEPKDPTPPTPGAQEPAHATTSAAATPVEATPPPAAGGDPLTVTDALRRVGRFVSDYERQLSSIVLEETYQQRVVVELGGPPDVRQLRSDVLLINDPDVEWVGFRDVFAVDGRRVRDRDDRLMKLFVSERRHGMDQVRRIVAENSRYNLNAANLTIERNINMPMTGLRFLMAVNHDRSEFKYLGTRTVSGRRSALLEFKERAKPRIIKTDNDAGAEGRVWFDPDSGAVMRTELWFEMTKRELKQTVSIRLRVSFAMNEKLNMWLPAEMAEEYRSGRTTIAGTAIYTNPRRFGVATTEQIK